MRLALVVFVASVSWVYLIEGVKRARWPGLHFRSGWRLWLLNLIGAVVITLILRGEWLMCWTALVIQQLVYDGVVHRRVRSGIR